MRQWPHGLAGKLFSKQHTSLVHKSDELSNFEHTGMERLGAVGGSERSLSKVQSVEAVYGAPGSLYERNMGWLPRANKVHTIPSG